MHFHLPPPRILSKAFPLSRRCWTCLFERACVFVFLSNSAFWSVTKIRRIKVLDTPCRRARAIWVGGLSFSVAKSTFLMRALVRLEGRICGPSLFSGFGMPWFMDSHSLITRETVEREAVIPISNRAAVIFLQDRPFRWWAKMAAFVSELVGAGIFDGFVKMKRFSAKNIFALLFWFVRWDGTNETAA